MTVNDSFEKRSRLQAYILSDKHCFGILLCHMSYDAKSVPYYKCTVDVIETTANAIQS